MEHRRTYARDATPSGQSTDTSVALANILQRECAARVGRGDRKPSGRSKPVTSVL